MKFWGLLFHGGSYFVVYGNEFCILKDLHFDSDFPEEFKDILKKYFNKDKREILLHKEIISYSGYQTLNEFEIAKQIK